MIAIPFDIIILWTLTYKVTKGAETPVIFECQVAVAFRMKLKL